MENVSRMFSEASKAVSPRERAKKHVEIYEHICSHYERYAKSITARLAELERADTVFAEIIEIKRLVNELSKYTPEENNAHISEMV